MSKKDEKGQEYVAFRVRLSGERLAFVERTIVQERGRPSQSEQEVADATRKILYHLLDTLIAFEQWRPLPGEGEPL